MYSIQNNHIHIYRSIIHCNKQKPLKQIKLLCFINDFTYIVMIITYHANTYRYYRKLYHFQLKKPLHWLLYYRNRVVPTSLHVVALLILNLPKLPIPEYNFAKYHLRLK